MRTCDVRSENVVLKKLNDAELNNNQQRHRSFLRHKYKQEYNEIPDNGSKIGDQIEKGSYYSHQQCVVHTNYVESCRIDDNQNEEFDQQSFDVVGYHSSRFTHYISHDLLLFRGSQ